MKEDGADSRRNNVALTSKGRALHDRLVLIALERQRELLADLTPDEVRAFTGMIDRLQAKVADGAPAGRGEQLRGHGLGQAEHGKDDVRTAGVEHDVGQGGRRRAQHEPADAARGLLFVLIDEALGAARFPARLAPAVAAGGRFERHDERRRHACIDTQGVVGRDLRVAEAGNVDVEVHGIVPPVTGGDHAPVKVEQAPKLNPVECGNWTPIPRMRKRRHDAQALFAFGAGARLAFSCATSARSASTSASSSARRTRPGSTSSPHGVP